MKNSLRGIVIIAVAATNTACSTYNTNPYGISVKNIETIKSLRISPVAVEKFTAFEPGLNSITCRGGGRVITANEQPFEKIIEDALTDELKLAGVYDSKSSIIIKGHLEYITFNSNIGIGEWSIKVKVSSKEKPDGFLVESKTDLSTNWVASKACQQVAQAFGPALQDLIQKIVSHPQFKALAL